jgi:multidrug transporter EmrE-like cation transporter
MRYILMLTSAFVLNAGSSLLYKLSSLNVADKKLGALLLVAGLILGAANALLYTRTLEGIKLNVAYPIFSAGSLLLVSLISLCVFNEGFSLQKLTGMGTLIAGVVLISL